METQVSKESRLFSGARIGSVELENRLAVAPMTRVSSSPEGVPTDDMAVYYESFARGGFGLVITEGTYPDEAHGQGYWNQPGLANGEQVEGWRRVTEAVHAGARGYSPRSCTPGRWCRGTASARGA